jgi:Spy/CpxP family protein refolding chaperone
MIHELKRAPAAVVLLIATLLCAFNAIAQESSSSNMGILREKLEADKKLLIASNQNLTEAQAEGFWPIYADYQNEQDAIYRKLGMVIRDYANEYNAGSLTDEKAGELLDAALKVDEAELALQRRYVKRLDGVIPMVKIVRYIQMERKIRAILRYDIAAQVPLVR